MSEAKFSKGPWSANHSCVMNGGETLCAMVNGSVYRNDDSEDYANAALISVAPEMYDFIKSIQLDSAADEIIRDRLLAKARGEKCE